WYRYLDFMDGEIRELLTNYGEIGGIWFDGWWDKPAADWRLEKTYKLIHDLQPAALIGNNHHRLPFEGEDFQMFEKDLPGGKTAEFNKDAQVGKLPLETCETINQAWGYNQNDHKFKSTRELVHYLVRAAGHNANFLLNVGPRPDGAIQPEFVERLREMGAWLGKNGDSIYGTREGPVPPRNWGVTTQKGQKVYVHILDLEDDVLALPRLPGKIAKASLVSGRAVEFNENKLGVMLKVDQALRDPLDTVVVLEMM
ncbi:MAG: alpha-L-fucosidase, partial [Acidobacteria bacterium]|nr:alpha-L-fucosidase [Acidobacteriota bacterium]